MQLIIFTDGHPDEYSIRQAKMVWDLCAALWGNLTGKYINVQRVKGIRLSKKKNLKKITSYMKYQTHFVQQ